LKDAGEEEGREEGRVEEEEVVTPLVGPGGGPITPHLSFPLDRGTETMAKKATRKAAPKKKK
jgi:hypothetical protein